MVSGAGPLDRREVVAALAAGRGDALFVSGLGSPTWDLAAAGDHERNFYLWGGMGGAATIGLGLALARPGLPVIALTGDGEMLMGLGALATIGAKRPQNLSVIVLDNERYGETGMQRSHTGAGVDLAAVARASGFDWSLTVRDEAGVDEVRVKSRTRNGCGFAAIKIGAADHPRVMPERDGALVKARFRKALAEA